MIRFETERLILRNYTMDDVPAVHEYFSNEEVSRYEDFWPQTVESIQIDGIKKSRSLRAGSSVSLITI